LDTPFFGFRLDDAELDGLSVSRIEGELEGEPLTVLVRPGGPDLRPESLIAFGAVFHGKQFMGWLPACFGGAGHDDVPFRCLTAHAARPCAVEGDGPYKRRGQKGEAPCRNGAGVPRSVLTPARGPLLIRTEKGRAVLQLDLRKGSARTGNKPDGKPRGSGCNEKRIPEKRAQDRGHKAKRAGERQGHNRMVS